MPRNCQETTQRQTRGDDMTKVVYRIVEHVGGWADKFDGVFSETYPSRKAAYDAAAAAATEERVPGRTEVIQYEDAEGKWHEETASGSDRPSTEVTDE